jgi:hypothetical protein
VIADLSAAEAKVASTFQSAMLSDLGGTREGEGMMDNFCDRRLIGIGRDCKYRKILARATRPMFAFAAQGAFDSKFREKLVADFALLLCVLCIPPRQVMMLILRVFTEDLSLASLYAQTLRSISHVRQATRDVIMSNGGGQVCGE